MMRDEATNGRERVIQSDREGIAFELRDIDCPTCGPEAKIEVGIRGGLTHRFGKGIESQIVRCERCGLYFPDPFPFPLDAQRLYGDPDKYFISHDLNKKLTSFRHLVRGFSGVNGA